jgi:hypothetical protein
MRLNPMKSRSYGITYHLTHQTFLDPDHLDQAIHAAILDLNRERMPVPLGDCLGRDALACAVDLVESQLGRSDNRSQLDVAIDHLRWQIGRFVLGDMLE